MEARARRKDRTGTAIKAKMEKGRNREYGQAKACVKGAPEGTSSSIRSVIGHI